MSGHSARSVPNLMAQTGHCHRREHGALVIYSPRDRRSPATTGYCSVRRVHVQHGGASLSKYAGTFDDHAYERHRPEHDRRRSPRRRNRDQPGVIASAEVATIEQASSLRPESSQGRSAAGCQGSTARRQHRSWIISFDTARRKPAGAQMFSALSSSRRSRGGGRNGRRKLGAELPSVMTSKHASPRFARARRSIPERGPQPVLGGIRRRRKHLADECENSMRPRSACRMIRGRRQERPRRRHIADLAQTVRAKTTRVFEITSPTQATVRNISTPRHGELVRVAIAG